MKGEYIGAVLLSMCLAQTVWATDSKDHFCWTRESISSHILKIIDNGCSTWDYYEKLYPVITQCYRLIMSYQAVGKSELVYKKNLYFFESKKTSN